MGLFVFFDATKSILASGKVLGISHIYFTHHSLTGRLFGKVPIVKFGAHDLEAVTKSTKNNPADVNAGPSEISDDKEDIRNSPFNINSPYRIFSIFSSNIYV